MPLPCPEILIRTMSPCPETSRGSHLCFLLVGAALIARPVGAQPFTPDAAVPGVLRVGAAGVRETTAQIKTRDRLMGAQPAQRHVAPRFVLPPEADSTSTSAPSSGTVRSPL